MRDLTIAGLATGRRIGAPMQAEAFAYFARMTTPPSAEWREAVNWAIWRWKAQGSWAHLTGLWLFGAETQQAALLSVIGDAAHDATLTGAPTFTAGQGFSGFSAANVVNFGALSLTTGWPDDNGYAFMAGRVDTTIAGNFIRSNAGTSAQTPGHFQNVTGLSGVSGGVASTVIAPPGGGVIPIVGGTRGLTMINPATIASGSSAGTARSASYRTTAVDGGPLQRLSAVGYLSSAAAAVEGRLFIATLAELLNQLGALD